MVVESLSRQGALDRMTLDLSQLVAVHSSFLAALVVIKKRVQASGGTLCLCGLQPIVREIFEQIRFDKVFDIVDW
jgi:anti-anti-sigma factor